MARTVTARSLGARSQIQSMSSFDSRTHPWLAGYAGTDGEPCTAQPPWKYIGRYSVPSGATSMPS